MLIGVEHDHHIDLIIANGRSIVLMFKRFLPSCHFFLSLYSYLKRQREISRKDNDTQLLEPPTMERFRNKATKQFDQVTAKFGSMDKYLDVAEIEPKCIKKKEIYISAEGYVFPCCWTAGQMYKWWQKPGEAQIWEHINKYNINAKEIPIEKIVNTFFNSIEEAWEVGPNRLKVCALKCNRQFDPFAAQWQ